MKFALQKRKKNICERWRKKMWVQFVMTRKFMGSQMGGRGTRVWNEVDAKVERDKMVKCALFKSWKSYTRNNDNIQNSHQKVDNVVNICAFGIISLVRWILRQSISSHSSYSFFRSFSRSYFTTFWSRFFSPGVVGMYFIFRFSFGVAFVGGKVFVSCVSLFNFSFVSSSLLSSLEPEFDSWCWFKTQTWMMNESSF